MEILKLEGKKITHFFDMTNLSNLNNYYRTINNSYANIPKGMHGKVQTIDNSGIEMV